MSSNAITGAGTKKAAQEKLRREAMNARYEAAYSQGADALLARLNTSMKGLSEDQADDARDEYGSNRVTHEKEKTTFQRIVGAFINPFTVILVALAVASIFTDIILPSMQGRPEDINILTAVIIFAMVIISGVMRFVQESRSSIAVRKLLEMITTTANVQRLETGPAEIPLEDIVVGDIVHLAAGDMVPADIRILQAKDMFISQSSLTGESDPLEKIPDAPPEKPGSYTECSNLAFMGSNVISGSAAAVVIATGDDTMFGSMAKSVSGQAVQTSFEKGVNAVSWVLIRFMLVMVPIVFLANGITTKNWMESLLFGLAVAVGLTPEMLPMIVTACLAKGAVAMSKKKTIIKNLNSMQNFGAIDILCTDKTGTLTQDKVVLTYYLDVHGNEEVRVLRHGFLNSYYQTGLKNLMDVAIIDKTQEEAEEKASETAYSGSAAPGLGELSKYYEKVDEIPFDFNRRRMSVVVEDKNGKTQMITKGAVEEMLSICAYTEYNGYVEPLTDELKEEILVTVDDLNDDGMRVIAVAQKTNPSPVGAFSVNDEADMVLIGYLAFLDPPKDDTAEAIRALKEYGVTTKILTGDNDKVTRTICKQVGLRVDNLLLGSDVEAMDDEQLGKAAETTNVFAKLSPDQKARIVTLLRERGHTVGYMGDGINDAAAMRASDIGISVDTAVDIAKESADIILLEKDLMVLEEGLVEGRKTYANMIKYIKMTASSNFGNMFSVVVASALIPFLPMLSIHIIFLNLIYDITCTSIPWDNVDKEFLRIPRKWDSTSIGSFMIWIGPTSSLFDITTYLLLFFYLGPKYVSGGAQYASIAEGAVVKSGLFTGMDMATAFRAFFHSGWLIESMWTQTLIIHMIRTPKVPFIKSHASWHVTTLTCMGSALLTVMPFTSFGRSIGLVALPLESLWWLIGTVALYMSLTTVVKKAYIRRHGELL
ncbi:MAG: magnesium-translocating P-type ATPase [Oscillospiraceae bacterium]|nr:magnesium-translocating P-type ATPase [Oscillospiraceae bacterium]